MKHLAPLVLLLSFLSCLSAQPRARRKHVVNTGPKPSSQSRPELIAESLDNPAEGELVGQTYENKFFGLKMTFPDGWLALTDAAREEVLERSKRWIKPRNAEEKEEMARSYARTINLLTVRQYLAPPPGQWSASFLIGGELLPVINMTPTQYALIMRDYVLPRSTAKYEPVGDIAPERIAGAEFALMKIAIINSGGIRVNQEYHVTIRRGYALAFVFSYVDEQQHTVLSEALNSIRLDGKAVK